jgi:hypothetical protein
MFLMIAAVGKIWVFVLNLFRISFNNSGKPFYITRLNNKKQLFSRYEKEYLLLILLLLVRSLTALHLNKHIKLVYAV